MCICIYIYIYIYKSHALGLRAFIPGRHDICSKDILGMWACYICLRSGCGSVGNVYNVFRGLRDFWGPSGA